MTDYSELMGDGKPEKKSYGIYVREDVMEHFRSVADDLDKPLSAVVQHVLLEQMKEDLEDETETKNEEN